MKVLVVSERRVSAMLGEYGTMVHNAETARGDHPDSTVARMYYAEAEARLTGAGNLWAIMTPIDVPDGCVLAVVNTNKGIGFQEEGDYVLLVQEVKL